MSFFQAIKSLFKAQSTLAPVGVVAPESPALTANAATTSFAATVAEDAMNADAAKDSKRLLEHYGDFTAFLYRQDFDRFLRKEALPFREPAGQYLTFLDKNHWADRHPFNFPGPFYCGESDTCGTGICQAPGNVMNDEHCGEFIFRQPTNYYELLCVLDAAAVEVFSSYSSNGNDFWTAELCKEWWSAREHLIAYLAREDVAKANNGQAQRYIEYLNDEAEIDLRRYCYFLENGIYPQDENVALPEL